LSPSTATKRVVADVWSGQRERLGDATGAVLAGILDAQPKPGGVSEQRFELVDSAPVTRTTSVMPERSSAWSG
jgi:hypothetical protein